MRIAVIGNCHGDIVAQTIRRALRTEPDIDCRHIVSYQTAGEADRAFIAAADRVVTQITDFKKHDGLETLQCPRAGFVVRFPLIACTFLYPFSGRPHPRAAESRSEYRPSGYYEGQLSDWMLIDLMDRSEGGPVETIVDEYMALDYSATVDLDRLYDLNTLKMQRLGEEAGLDLWPKIDRLFRHRPLFWTVLHPDGSLLRDVCRHALIGLRLGLDGEAINDALSVVKEPLGFAHAPVHPSIVKHFDIEWAEPLYRYRIMPDGQFTAREFAERFVRFDHDDLLDRAIFQVHANRNLDGGVADLEEARLRLPGNCDVLVNLAMGYWKQGRIQQAMEATISALEIDPKQSEWAELLCILARQSDLAGLHRAAPSVPHRDLVLA